MGFRLVTPPPTTDLEDLLCLLSRKKVLVDFEPPFEDLLLGMLKPPAKIFCKYGVIENTIFRP